MSNYFNAYEVVDELIDDVNQEIYERYYDAIYEELCRRVEEGELSLEDAEILNEAAADKYLVDKGVFKTKEQKQKEEEEAKAAAKKKLKKNIVKGVGGAVGAGFVLKKIHDKKSAKKQSRYSKEDEDMIELIHQIADAHRSRDRFFKKSEDR